MDMFVSNDGLANWNLGVKRVKYALDEGAFSPERAHEFDAGADIRTPNSFVLSPRGSVIVDTGVHIEVPEGFVCMVKSKSGLNLKQDILTTGVVDAHYTGEIRVKIYNFGDNYWNFERGDKITQIVIVPCLCCNFEKVEALDEKIDRGNAGFGSTGR